MYCGAGLDLSLGDKMKWGICTIFLVDLLRDVEVDGRDDDI
jgi:hypothetical protein